ncbi:bud emergence protein 1, partial [Allomyces javanicus]
QHQQHQQPHQQHQQQQRAAIATPAPLGSNSALTPTSAPAPALALTVPTSTAQPTSAPASPTAIDTSAFPATVVYAFDPEQSDELLARPGDHVHVLAHSGEHWAVAHFVGKPGAPGLIPFSYLAVRDPTTQHPIRDVHADILARGRLPTLRAWKARHSAPPAMPPARHSDPNPHGIQAVSGGPPRIQPHHKPLSYQSAGSAVSLDSGIAGTARLAVPGAPPPLMLARIPPAGANPPPGPQSPSDARLVAVTIPAYEYRAEPDDYWYAVHTHRADGARAVLYRHANEMRDVAHVVDAWTRAERLPPVPGTDVVLDARNDAASETYTRARRPDLEAFLAALIAHPSADRLLSAPAVAHFFRPHAGDKLRRPSVPVDPSAAGLTPRASRDAIMGAPGPSSRPTSSGHDPLLIKSRPTSAEHTDAAALAAADPAAAAVTPPSLALKIKIVAGADVVAIRCNPATLTYTALIAKIADKLYAGDMARIGRLMWRKQAADAPHAGSAASAAHEAGEWVELDGEAALADAVKVAGDRMLVYVQ